MGNDILKFCGKFIILFALVFVIDILVGLTYRSMKNVALKNNPESMWLKTPYVVEKVNSDILVFGSSKATHDYVVKMMSDSLRCTVYNCGQDGCFFLYQNCLINMVLDRYRPKIIIWDVQPSCLLKDSKMSEYQNIRYLSPYYKQNEWAHSFVNSQKEMINIKMKSQMFAYNSKILYYLFPLVTKGKSTQDGYIPLPSDGYNYPELSSDSVADSEYEPSEEKFELFGSTLKRCKNEGVELFVFASPSFTHKGDLYDGVVLDLQKVAAQYGYSVYDYGDYYLDDPTKFKDSGHLNHKGAVAYTDIVIATIQKKELYAVDSISQ